MYNKTVIWDTTTYVTGYVRFEKSVYRCRDSHSLDKVDDYMYLFKQLVQLKKS